MFPPQYLLGSQSLFFFYCAQIAARTLLRHSHGGHDPLERQATFPFPVYNLLLCTRLDSAATPDPSLGNSGPTQHVVWPGVKFSYNININITVKSSTYVQLRRTQFIMLFISESNSVGSSHAKPHLSLGEKLGLVAKLLVSIPYVIFEFVYDIASSRKFTFQAFNTTLIKCGARVSRLFSLRQIHSVIRPTGVTVSKFCQAQGLSHDKVLLDGEQSSKPGKNHDHGDEDDRLRQSQFKPATLHFVDCAPGNKKVEKKKVLLYSHGGGYIFPMIPGQIRFARAAAQKMHSDLAILEYTLAPTLRYPGQLAQAAAALRYLLQRYEATQIIIGGDSAGANLSLSVLAHMKEPQHLVRPVFEEEDGIDQRKNENMIRGALCISPRCANSYEAPSFANNGSKDIINGRSMRSFVSNWKPNKDEVWASPLVGDRAFWQDIKAERVLLVGGLDEVFVDDIVKFAARIGAVEDDGSNAKLQVALCPGEIHTQAVLDVGAGYMDGFMSNKIFSWLETV